MLNKQEFINLISDREEVSKKEAAMIVKAFTGAVNEVLQDKKGVSLVGFGKFFAEYKPEKEQVLGLTGELIKVPAHYILKSKLSKSILENK